jgi:hypothetical protein
LLFRALFDENIFYYWIQEEVAVMLEQVILRDFEGSCLDDFINVSLFSVIEFLVRVLLFVQPSI